jgi:hypothetical protein
MARFDMLIRGILSLGLKEAAGLAGFFKDILPI